MKVENLFNAENIFILLPFFFFTVAWDGSYLRI